MNLRPRMFVSGGMDKSVKIWGESMQNQNKFGVLNELHMGG